MKYRLFYNEGVTKEIIKGLLNNFGKWEEISNYYEKNRSKQNLLNNIKDRVRKLEFNPENDNSYELNYEDAIIFPDIEQILWQNSKYSKILIPKKNFLLLQQPSENFERLFKLSLEKITGNKSQTIFFDKNLVPIINNLKKAFSLKNWEFFINRVIFDEINFNGIFYEELNFKQNKISISFINDLSQKCKGFNAFTLRANGYFGNEVKRISFRLDKYGKALLYGNHSPNFNDFYFEILSYFLKLYQNKKNRNLTQ